MGWSVSHSVHGIFVYKTVVFYTIRHQVSIKNYGPYHLFYPYFLLVFVLLWGIEDDSCKLFRGYVHRRDDVLGMATGFFRIRHSSN